MSKTSSNRDILVKNRLYVRHWLLWHGEVITKGSNCVIYVTVCTTIKIAHCKNSSLWEKTHSKREICIVRETSMVKHHYHVFHVSGVFCCWNKWTNDYL